MKHLALLVLAFGLLGCTHTRLSTDRSEYAATDIVELRLTNLGTRTVGYNLCISQAERVETDGWEKVDFPDRICTMELRLLRPGRRARFEIPLEGDLEPGTYRLTTEVEAPLGTAHRPVFTPPFEVSAD